MSNFWAQRSQRERQLLMVLAGLIVAMALYYLVASPLMQWRDNASRDVTRAETTYALVREAASAARSGVSAPLEGDGAPVRNILIQSARSSGVTLNFVNARADDSVESSVEAVSPDVLFRWLAQLNERYSIEVLTADISRDSDNRALVRAQFLFKAR